MPALWVHCTTEGLESVKAMKLGWANIMQIGSMVIAINYYELMVNELKSHQGENMSSSILELSWNGIHHWAVKSS